MKQTISVIAAVAENGVIGRDDQMPWHLPADLAHFKLLTWGKPVVMGRKTFQAIGKPLPGRQNIVVTRDAAWTQVGVTVARSLAAAFAAAGAAAEVLVIGGAQLYAEALPLAGRVYLTRVHADVDGDVLFPRFDLERWRETARHEHLADERNRYSLSFITYERS